jgi:hypothetical protein
MCLAGQCVSNCNPPCAPGEQCRDGECVQPAPTPPPEQVPEGFETHDGFMLRFTTGLGWSSAWWAREEGASDEVSFGGFSGSFSFDIGGALTENLILHARFADLPMFDPTVYVNGDKVLEIEDASLTGVVFGPALTYYFMPANIYLTLALGISALVLDTERMEARGSDVGFGSNLDIGKEWWVSDNWGLGIAARFWFTSVSDTVDNDMDDVVEDVTYNMSGFAVLFSATYN